MSCCSEEGFFPGGADEPVDTIALPDDVQQRRTRSISPIRSAISNDGSSRKRRRKKPLAVAVGFNYANDMNGRPIVVTPGGSRSLLEITTASRQSPELMSASTLKSNCLTKSPPRIPTLNNGTTEDTVTEDVQLSYKSPMPML